MKRFFDPTWRVNPALPSARAVVVTPNEEGSQTCAVQFMGREMTARSAGGRLLEAGETVSFVESADGPPWVVQVDEDLGADYPTRFARKLAEWSARAPASLLLRYAMRGNPTVKDYRTVIVTAFDEETGVASFDGGTAPVLFGTEDAMVSAGDLALLFDSGHGRHIIGATTEEDEEEEMPWNSETGEGTIEAGQYWHLRARKIFNFSFDPNSPWPQYRRFRIAVSNDSDEIAYAYDYPFVGDEHGVEGAPGSSYLFQQSKGQRISTDGTPMGPVSQVAEYFYENGIFAGDHVAFLPGLVYSPDRMGTMTYFSPSHALLSSYVFPNGTVCAFAEDRTQNWHLFIETYLPPFVTNYAPVNRSSFVDLSPRALYRESLFSFCEIGAGSVLAVVASRFSTGNYLTRMFRVESSGSISEIMIPAIGIASVVVIDYNTWVLISATGDIGRVTRDAGATWDKEHMAGQGGFFLRTIRFKGGCVAIGANVYFPNGVARLATTVAKKFIKNGPGNLVDEGRIIGSDVSIRTTPGDWLGDVAAWSGYLASLLGGIPFQRFYDNCIQSSADKTKMYAAYQTGEPTDSDYGCHYSIVELTYGE